MNKKEILISGAGIAGLSLALFLDTDKYNITIVEKSTKLSTGGQKIDIRGSAREIIKKHQLYDVLKKHNLNFDTVDYLNSKGKSRLHITSDLLNFTEEQDLDLLRGDLIEVLLKKVMKKAKIVYSCAIESLISNPDFVEVKLNGQFTTQKYDFVIGADGIHSRVRTLLFGDCMSQLKHLNDSYFASFSFENNKAHAIGREFIFAKKNRSIIFYSNGFRTHVLILVKYKGDKLMRDLDKGYQISRLKLLFAKDPWIQEHIFRYIDNADDFYFNSIHQLNMDVWHKEKVVLLGDAAYCTSLASGMGSSLAILGAYLLSEVLNKQNSRINFQEYYNKMIPSVDASMKIARGNIQSMIVGTEMKLCISTLALKYLQNRKFFTNKMEDVKKDYLAISNMIYIDNR